jgi:hypothetical protein
MGQSLLPENCQGYTSLAVVSHPMSGPLEDRRGATLRLPSLEEPLGEQGYARLSSRNGNCARAGSTSHCTRRLVGIRFDANPARQERSIVRLPLQSTCGSSVAPVDPSSDRAFGIARVGADAGSSATGSGSRSVASTIESISRRTELEFSGGFFEAHGPL